MSDKNKNHWNNRAASYSDYNHSERQMARLTADPANAFHPTTWALLRRCLPDLRGLNVCVPSSGDNHTVFAFAMLGARVTSCDISENQLANAARVARQYSWDASVDFVCADTMKLAGLPDGAYDFVYTSNGVHVWIDDLPGMYRSVARVLRTGGLYLMHEIHPFLRPFDDKVMVKQPYDDVGPHDSDTETTFSWRVMDILNALLDAGLNIKHIEEMFAEKRYDEPFWIPYHEIEQGATATREEVDSMHDWRHNPLAALPNWLAVAARKG